MSSRGVRWQVPYGKHSPVDNETHRQFHKAGNEKDIPADNVLAIVTIRDPYFWMDSMCRHPYQMEWPDNPNQCPKLVPTADDPSVLRQISSIPVRIKYDGTERLHYSMVHHYNEWYGAYWNATWPRVMVRYEDLIFHPRKVTQTVCECAGGRLTGSLPKGTLDENGQENRKANPSNKEVSEDDVEFYYVKESAKDNSAVHGRHKSGLLEAMLQYSRENRNHNMTKEDLDFTQQSLNPQLLDYFHYKTILAGV